MNGLSSNRYEYTNTGYTRRQHTSPPRLQRPLCWTKSGSVNRYARTAQDFAGPKNL